MRREKTYSLRRKINYQRGKSGASHHIAVDRFGKWWLVEVSVNRFMDHQQYSVYPIFGPVDRNNVVSQASDWERNRTNDPYIEMFFQYFADLENDKTS